MQGGGASLLDSVVSARPGSSLQFEHNTAQFGGALFVASSDSSFPPSSASLLGTAAFRHNAAQQQGGAVFVQGLAQDQPATLLADAGAGAAGAVFESNEATVGGGISATYFALLDLRLAEFHGNAANESGGGVMLQANSMLRMVGGRFEDNVGGGKGGAVAAFESSLAANGVVFANNSAWFQGGAIAALTTSSVSLGGCILANNSVWQPSGIVVSASSSVDMVGGGAVFASDSTAVALGNGSAVMGNSVMSGDGGGLLLRDTATLAAEGGAVDGNSAQGFGGGIALHDATTAALDGGVLLRGNKATQGGGGVFAGGGMALLGDVDLTGNWAGGTGGGVLMYGPVAADGRVNISGNGATGGGGGVFASGWLARLAVGVRGTVVVEANQAGGDGGGLYLEDRCRPPTAIATATRPSNIFVCLEPTWISAYIFYGLGSHSLQECLLLFSHVRVCSSTEPRGQTFLTPAPQLFKMYGGTYCGLCSEGLTRMGRLGPAGLGCRPGARGTRRRGMLRGFPVMLCSSTCKRLLHPCTYSRSALRWWPLLLGFFFSGRGGGGQCSAGYEAAGEECPSTCVALWRGNGYCNTEWWVVALQCKASSIQLFVFSRSFSESAETASPA